MAEVTGFNLGGVGHSKDVNSAGLAIFMAFDENQEYHDQVHILKDEIKVIKDAEQHEIDKIPADEHKVLVDFEKGTSYGYKVCMRELLLLNKILHSLYHTLKVHNQDTKHVEHLIRDVEQTLERMKKSKDNEHLRKLYTQIEAKEVENDDEFKKQIRPVIHKIYDDLDWLRKQLHGIMQQNDLDHEVQGMELLMKNEKLGLFQKIYMRWSTKRQRIDSKLAEKDEHDIEKLEEEANKIMSGIDLKLKKHNASVEELEKNGEGLKVKILEEFKDVRDLATHIRLFLEKLYRVIMFDYIMLRQFVLIIRENRDKHLEFLKENYIPEILGKKDIAEVIKDSKNLEHHLENVETFIKQIWSLTTEVKNELR
ncbi:MAG: hypothetical protein ABIC95_03520 [archaeon]